MSWLPARCIRPHIVRMGMIRLLRRGTARHLLLSLGLGSLLALGGCGDEPVPPALSIPEELARCDITEGPCQRGIYLSVAEMLGAEDYLMPRIRTISVEEHADEVRSGLDVGDLTGEDPESRGLRLMGFIPEASESLASTQAEYWITRVAAYYSRGSNSITVIDRDYEQGTAQVLLAHELIHAIQHAQFNLGTVGSGVDTEDGNMGVRSVIEGDAVYSSFAWYYDVAGYADDEIDWDSIADDRTTSLRESVTDPELALIDSASSFPYSYGFRFMAKTSLAEGLRGRADAFEGPPATALQIMRGYGTGVPVLDLPEVAHPAPLDGREPEVRNRFGAWYVYAALRRQGLGDEDAWNIALDWVGDELAIFNDGEEVVAVWRVRFEDEADAALLTDEVNALAEDTARSAVAFGEDAFVFAAESTDTLLAWVSQPLDSMTASIVPKSRVMSGAVSVGDCMLPHDVPVLVRLRSSR